MVTPEFKAIAQLTASILKCSLMELMQKGVYNLATAAGVLKNGSIADEHKEAIAAMAEMIRFSLTSKRKG